MQRRIKRHPSSLWLWLISWTMASTTAAQAPAPVILPPKVVSLPELQLPEGASRPPDDAVQVEITVDATGRAILDACAADAALCAAVGEAIASARFEPARRGEAAIAARVRVVLRIVPDASASLPPALASEHAAAPPPAAAVPNDPPKPPTPPPLLDFSARARKVKLQPGSRRLELAEMRDLPGALGDPFRAVDTLPGVVPIFSGLPYFVIRGSPPSGSLYIYDNIPLPALYHLAVGPAAIHPRMVGPITLYSGVAPARYGRLTGGAIVGEGPERPDGRTHIESELRLLDVSGYVQTAVPGGTLTAAARYGYPGLLLSIFSPQVDLAYWDYQLRYAGDISPSTRVEVVALGSHDALSVADEPGAGLALSYHRVEPRLIHRLGRSEYGAAVLFGWEESMLGSGFQLNATRLGPRAWFEHPLGSRSRLRVSADMQAISGNFSRTTPDGMRDISGDTESVGLAGDVSARSLWGLQLELNLRPSGWDLFEVQLGLRADAWLQSGGAQGVVDPRLRVVLHAADSLRFHLAAGAVHQPAVFYIPLPGIADLATDQGLQGALQSEVGVSWDTPLELQAELQFFAHRYLDLMFLDTLLLTNALDSVCSDRNLLQVAECDSVSIPSRQNGLSYGAEVFLRRPVTERLSGFLSYTLARSTTDPVAGLPYTPSWDVRHVANVVLQWRVVAGLSGGLRWFVRSGKVNGDFILDETRHLFRDERRLPAFSRLDLELAYAWRPSWGRMRVAIEWFNVAMAREPQGVSCSGLPRTCEIEYLPAIFFPNLSVRGEH